VTLRLPLALAAWSASAAFAAAAPSAADEILAALQTRLESGEDSSDLARSLADLPAEQTRQVVTEVEQVWPKLRDTYLAGFERSLSGGDKQADRALVREQRAEFLRIYQLDEARMKPLLSKSQAAVEQLRKSLLPAVEDLVQAGGAELAKRRAMIHGLAAFRDAALDAALSTVESDAVESLAKAEQAVAAQASGLDRDGLRLLEKNRKIAEDEEIPAEEAAGIEECNVMRLLLGLNALLLDPKLCEAARGHSKDMAEQGFFAHESPLPGKKTPWDRAAQAGTTASAENIFAGGSDPHSANMGWFHSPGHHKNMFGSGHARIGLGRHGGHWTQMFGR
jgi:uncharacterized protein YkwD